VARAGAGAELNQGTREREGIKPVILYPFIGSFIMAVQQNKKSPSKRGMHRAHDFLTNPPLALEPTTGEVHLRHHISPSGYYRGKKVVKSKGE
jgi:large subunit ribosomal protein L32